VKFASWNGSSWDISVIDTLRRVYLELARTTVSLDLDADDNPHISYGDEKVVKYATLSGSTWMRETIVDVNNEETIIGQVTNIAVDTNGKVHVVYYEILTRVPITGNIKHATREPATGIPCGEITNFLARCTNNGMVQARAVLRDNIAHSGETVMFQIDATTYPAVIGDNGTSSRASISISGLGAGDHTVSLIDPAGCFNPIVVTCAVSSNQQSSEWELDDLEWTGDSDLTASSQRSALVGNSPNPFNPATTIRYVLGEDTRAILRVYNAIGQEVATLVDGYQAAGNHSVVWNGTNASGRQVSGGIYFYALTANGKTSVQRMVLLK
jgi:hypothetical protein